MTYLSFLPLIPSANVRRTLKGKLFSDAYAVRRKDFLAISAIADATSSRNKIVETLVMEVSRSVADDALTATARTGWQISLFILALLLFPTVTGAETVSVPAAGFH